MAHFFNHGEEEAFGEEEEPSPLIIIGKCLKTRIGKGENLKRQVYTESIFPMYIEHFLTTKTPHRKNEEHPGVKYLSLVTSVSLVDESVVVLHSNNTTNPPSTFSSFLFSGRPPLRNDLNGL